MLSSSTPDLREDSHTSLPVSSSAMDPSSTIAPASGKRLHGGAIKDMVARPGSAPATKFSDCDSAFEEGGDADPTPDLGDIFSVLSVDEDPAVHDTNHPPNPDADNESEKTPKPGTDSSTDPCTSDRNFETVRQEFSRHESDLETGKLTVCRSYIPAIAEVSGEDSDGSNYQSNRLRNPSDAGMMPSDGGDRNPSLLRPKSPAGQQTVSYGKTGVDLRPPRLKSLQMPLVCVSTSDDTSSDSNDEVTQILPPAMRRNGCMYRRRHSLASTTADQITRMLLSHRRGSSSGLPIPCAECFQKIHSQSASALGGKSVKKQRSADSGKYTSPSGRSVSTIVRPDRLQLFPQASQESLGRRSSRSKSPFRVVTPRDTTLNSSMYIRPVSPEPVSKSSDGSQRIASPRPLSPRAVYPASGNLSPKSLSPRSVSPRPKSPRLVRQRPVTPRDEIEMILSRTPPQTDPPRSLSPRPPSPSTSSMSLTVPSQQSDRSRSPSSKMMLSASPQPRTRSRSPRPRQDRNGRSSGRSYSTIDVGESAGAKRELQKPEFTGENLAVHGRPSRTRSRSPVPHSLKPDGQSTSRCASPRPNRARSPRPKGHEPTQSRRRSAQEDKIEISSLSMGTQSRRPSLTPRIPDDSDDGNFGVERPKNDRRKRRGSRGKIVPLSDQQGGLNSLNASRIRWSRRSSISVPHPTQAGEPIGPSERADIAAKLAKRGRRRSSWAAGVGELPLMMTPVSALTLLRESNAEEETEQTRDPYALTLHFITDPGQSQPLLKILRPLIESIVPKLKLFNFVERSESAARDRAAVQTPDRDKPATVPTLGVVLLLQEEFGMERILEAQKYLRSEPWELHHRGKVGSNNVPYPTNNQDFYAHQTRTDSALWAVRQVHFGKDRLRFQLFVSDEMWADSISFYALLLSRCTHVQKEDFCYFLVFCSRHLNLEVQLALKKLPPGYKPQFLESTILQFKVGDMGQLVPLLPRVCIPISEKRWQTADPDGNKVLLFKDGDCCATPVASAPSSPESPDPKCSCPLSPSNSRVASERAPSCEPDSPDHQIQEQPVHFDERMHESNLVSAV